MVTARVGTERFSFAAAALLALLLGILFSTTFVSIARICLTSDDYSHGVILPFISLYLVWENRQAILSYVSLSAVRQSTSALVCGGVLLALGCALFLFASVTELLFFSWLAFFPITLGILYLAFDTRIAHLVAGPLLLLFMAKPLPDSLIPKLFYPLQVIAARASAVTLDVLEVPVHLVGNIIEIPGMTLQVEEACSGLRSVLALLTVGVIVCATTSLPIYGWFLILILSVSIAIFQNIVRAALTGVLAHFYDPQAATGFFHTFSGLIVFLIGPGVLFQCARFIQRPIKRPDRDDQI